MSMSKENQAEAEAQMLRLAQYAADQQLTPGELAAKLEDDVPAGSVYCWLARDSRPVNPARTPPRGCASRRRPPSCIGGAPP